LLLFKYPGLANKKPSKIKDHLKGVKEGLGNTAQVKSLPPTPGPRVIEGDQSRNSEKASSGNKETTFGAVSSKFQVPKSKYSGDLSKELHPSMEESKKSAFQASGPKDNSLMMIMNALNEKEKRAQLLGDFDPENPKMMTMSLKSDEYEGLDGVPKSSFSFLKMAFILLFLKFQRQAPA
jgi:hypothetical protein